jgi:hypothetical protein
MSCQAKDQQKQLEDQKRTRAAQEALRVEAQRQAFRKDTESISQRLEEGTFRTQQDGRLMFVDAGSLHRQKNQWLAARLGEAKVKKSF